MTEDEAIKESLELIEKSRSLLLATIDENGFPNVKTLFNMEHQNLKTFWFGTNTSSMHLQQILINPKTCVYAVDFENFRGLTLIGETEILQDADSKQRLWREGFECYYPKGVTDPDYSVMRFSAQCGRYYHGLQKVSFSLQ